MDLTDRWAPAPCQGPKGPDISGSKSKASQLTAFLLKEMAMWVKPSRTMLLSPNDDCADSGRRNTKLNCRDADASVDGGHLTSSDFLGWTLTSKSGEKRSDQREWGEFSDSKPWPPALYLQDGGTKEREPVFLNPLKNMGFLLLQKRAIWLNDTFQLCGATQPRCWSTLDVLIHPLSK